ncbi:S-layer homology domain-containing protein [Bacillus massiliigorillae]|uniref:S-layer homology domain-containing protein n=1 Tax=Bacillus massiliigorillae TaxID=1243664 RepID=UPI0003A7B3AA|nr:S-layer homology domain-containing protein [Bacillus massiliigorillae]
MAYKSKDYRKFVATAATATLVAGAIAPLASAASVSDFTDVKKDGLYYDAVKFLLDKGATNGKSATQFGVTDNITRLDAAIQLVTVLGLEVDNSVTKTQFSDVKSEKAKYVDALVKAGITTGKSDTQFGAYEEITRGQLAIWIAKGFKLEGTSDKQFTDVSKTGRYYDAVQALIANDVTTGKNGTQFGTEDKATRGQFAIFLYRADAAKNPAASDAKVEAVKAENGNVTVTLDKEVEAVTAADFKLTQSIDGKEATDVTPSAVKLADDKKTVEITVPAVEQAAAEQSVVVSVAYKAGEAKTAEAFKVAQKALAVESVNAIGAKKIEVKFTSAVDSKATIEVKKGSAKINTESVTLSADNKTAVIELSGKMTEGTYSVNATSGEQKLTGSVTVTNEKVGSVEILSENAVLNADASSVTVGYQVKNQYGEDITKTTSLIANAAGTVVTGTPTITQSKSIVTINVTKDKVKEGDTLTLTLVHGETGKSATKTVKVSAKSQVADVTLASLYNKDGKTLTETTDLTKDKFYVLVDAVDQYGKVLSADELKASGEKQNIVLNETNPLVADVANTFETITVDGKDRVALRVEKPTTGLVVGETTVMAIATSTGKNSSLKITVAEGKRAETAVINTPELVVAGEKTFLPIEVTDKDGNAITDVNVLKDTKRGVALSGGSVTTSDWTTKDGKTGVYLDLSNDTQSSYKTIVAVTAANKTAIQNIQVKEAAKPVRIDGLTSDVKTTLLAGPSATTTISLAGVKVIDQYERELTNAQKAKIFADDAYKLVFTEEKATDADKGVIQVSNNGVVTLVPQVEGKYVIGSEKVTVAIQKKDETSPISGSEKTVAFRVTDGTEYVSYEVEKIGNIFDEVGADLADRASNGYTKDITVYGVLDNGSKVKLVAGQDYSVDAPAWLKVSGQVDQLNPGTVPYATDAKEAKADITVTINATGDVFKQEVNVSKVKPTITSLKVVAEDTTSADAIYANKTTFDDIKELSAVKFTSSKVAENVDFAVVDSYGVMHVLDNATSEYLPEIKLLVKPNTANSLTITNNNSALATIDGFKAEDFVNVTVSVGDVSKSFKINGDKDAQGDVDAAKALAEAIEKFNAEKSKTEAEMKTKTEADYTVASWKAVTDALAIDVKGKTVEQVNLATAAIKTAFEGLTPQQK